MQATELDCPLIAFPIKSRFGKYKLNEKIIDCYRSLPYLAAEVTISTSTLIKAHKLIKDLFSKANGRKVYLRFHTPRSPNYDPFLSSADGCEARNNIFTLVDFISQKFGGGFLVLHSTVLPDSQSLHRCMETVKLSAAKGVVLCLENLADGWTSDLDLLGEVLEKTGMKAVLDIGHLNTSDCIRFSKINKLDAVSKLVPFLAGAHIYEHECSGHQPFSDFYLVGEILNVLYENKIYWWVLELEKEEEFTEVFNLLNHFLVSLGCN